jgi:hypothetical protein
MTSSIDPTRRSGPVRRTRKSAPERSEAASEADASNMPVPVGRAETVPPATPVDGGAAIHAHLLGQTGARRGLRAGATIVDTANSAYNKAEWSGSKDRRAPKGRVAKTDI